MATLEDEVSELYEEPGIGASNINTYGEENIRGLLEKYKGLDSNDSLIMLKMVKEFSLSPDLASSFVSVAVLHALGKSEDVQAAEDLARKRTDSDLFLNHFEIGKSIADYYFC